MSVLLKVQLANVLSQLSLSLFSVYGQCVCATLHLLCRSYFCFIFCLVLHFLGRTQVIATVDHKVAPVSHFSTCSRNEGQI